MTRAVLCGPRFRRFGLLLAVAFAAGCAGGKDNSAPPAPLKDFKPSLEVHELWSTKVGGGSERLRLGLEPSTNGRAVFAAGHDGRIEALDAKTGKRLWRVDTKLPFSAGPAYADGMLAVGTTDGDLLAFDAKTGTQRWRRSVGAEILAPPAIGSGVVVLRTVDGRLRAYSADDGKDLWSAEQTMPSLILRGETAPKIANGIVVAGFDNGHLAAYRLQTGETLWDLAIATPTGRNELARLVDISAGLDIVGNNVFAVGYQGRAVAVDLTTGLVLWQQDMSSFAGLDVDENNVYVTNAVGNVIALSRRAGAPVWRQEALKNRNVTGPTRFGNAVVVGDLEGYLHWLSVDDGHFVARVRAAHARITSAPVIVADSIVVQAEDGSVAAFISGKRTSK